MLKRPASSTAIIGILSLTQVVSWGSLYYAFSILAIPMQQELGWRTEVIFGAFSWSLLVAGLASAPVGLLLDRLGGRLVMCTGSVTASAGLIMLGLAESIFHYFLAWSMLGVAMSLVLYEAAFGTINRELEQGARKAISIVALSGGLASTVFWPLTLKLDGEFGWRATCFVYAALHLLMCAPLHALLSATPRSSIMQKKSVASGYTLREAMRHTFFWKLAFAFAANIFIFGALSVHLIPTLQRLGHSPVTAVFMATLIGPMQVVGRIAEMAFAKKMLPQTVGKLIFAILPAALMAVMFFGEHEFTVALFCMVYGISNGVLTIVRGTVPQTLFGREHYGAIVGALASPSLFAKAAGPLAIAMFVQSYPDPQWLFTMLWVISVVSLILYFSAVKAARAKTGAASAS